MNTKTVMLAMVVLMGSAACYDVQTSITSCETNEECVDVTGGEYDYCGQEGVDVCCVAGKYKCGCIGDDTCDEGYECYACNGDVCANDQPTICLDVFGAVAGLELQNP